MLKERDTTLLPLTFIAKKGQDAKNVDLILKDCTTTDNFWFNSQWATTKCRVFFVTVLCDQVIVYTE